MNAYAENYEQIFYDCIKEFGVFDGDEGIVYASFEFFEDDNALLIVYFENNAICASLYSAKDGGECVDKLRFVYGSSNNYMLSKGKTGDGKSCITFNTNGINEVFILQDDAFLKLHNGAAYDLEEIAGYAPTGIICKKNPIDIYITFNSLKLKKINSSQFTDCKDGIDKEIQNKIVGTISGCSDVVMFNRENYDLISLLKNILYTYKNYEGLTSLHPEYTKNTTETGYEDIHSLNGDYIDFILTSVYGVTPQHMSVNNLINNGVCYTNGKYFYTGEYTGNFKTEISNLEAIYDLGWGKYYVIFKDNYTEDSKIIPEYSFCVIDTTNTTFSLERIEFGTPLLDDNEIARYSPSKDKKGLYLRQGDKFLYAHKKINLASVLVVISVIAVIFALAAIFVFLLDNLIRKKKKY